MNNVQKELKDTKAALLQAISSVSDNRFNTVPFKGSWTAAQVADHLLKAVGTAVLYGKTKPTERKPDEKAAETAKLFLNMDIKMKSPDFILPSEDEQDKQVIFNRAETTFSKLIEAAETLDLSLICLDFEIPGFGEFTRLEFIWFYIVHTQRHINQLKNIAKVLGGQ
jgi:hypothetical protein